MQDCERRIEALERSNAELRRAVADLQSMNTANSLLVSAISRIWEDVGPTWVRDARSIIDDLVAKGWPADEGAMKLLDLMLPLEKPRHGLRIVAGNEASACSDEVSVCVEDKR